MAYFEPDGYFYLLENVDADEDRIPIFKSQAAQTAYMESRIIARFDNLSYVHHNGTISLEVSPELVRRANYCMFKQETQGDYTYYARILDVSWVNPAPTCEITYAIDWFQTAIFDAVPKSVQILREQLSEADWEKALANPYDYSISELNTPESFAAGKTLEPIYDSTDLTNAKASTIWPQDDAGKVPPMYVTMFFTVGWLADLSDEQRSVFDTTIEESGYAVRYIPDLDSDTPSVIVGGFPNVLGFIAWADGGGYQSVIDLLTLWQLTDNIVSIYYLTEQMVDVFKSGASYFDGKRIEIALPKGSDYKHPKLARSPFSYIRVTTPEGLSKEYHYENFAYARNGAPSVYLVYNANPNGQPTEFICPSNYMNATYSLVGDENVDERVEYTGLPTVPYNTDAWATYYGSQLTSYIANKNELDQLADIGTGTAGLAGSIAAAGGLWLMTAVSTALPNLSQTLKGMFGGVSSTAQLSAALSGTPAAQTTPSKISPSAYLSSARTAPLMNAVASLSRPLDMYEAATEYGSKSYADTLAATPLDYAKRAYVNDAYHPSTAGAYVPYQMGRGCPRWRITKVGLEEHTEQLYADFLNRMGCASQRVGVPRVLEYITGGEDLPHFEEIDGKMCTPCMVAGDVVHMNNKFAETYINQVFKAGCVFVQGDAETDTPQE